MPTNTSFSSGFASGAGAITNRNELRLKQQQQQQDQQNLLREQAITGVGTTLEEISKAQKQFSTAFFTSKGNNDQKGMDEAIAGQEQFVKTLWESTEKTLRAVGLPESDINIAKERFRIGARLDNPVAEARLEEQVKTEGAVSTAEGKQQFNDFARFENASGQAIAVRKGDQPPAGFVPVSATASKQDITTTSNTPKTVSTLQDKLIQTRDRKQRLLNIRASFRPELLETWTKMRAKFVAGTEKHLGIEPSEKDKQLITDITNFRGETALGINQTIHDMTGAQMSQFEAKRLRMPEPDVGEKLLEGQSPTEFKANVERAIRDMELADLRFTKLLKEGVITEADIDAGTAGDKAMGLIPLGKMEELYEQRGAQILEEVKLLNPKLTDDEAFNMANQKLKAEFTM